MHYCAAIAVLGPGTTICTGLFFVIVHDSAILFFFLSYLCTYIDYKISHGPMRSISESRKVKYSKCKSNRGEAK